VVVPGWRRFGLSVYIAWYAVRLVWVSHARTTSRPRPMPRRCGFPQISMALGCIGFALSLGHALVSRWRAAASSRRRPDAAPSNDQEQIMDRHRIVLIVLLFAVLGSGCGLACRCWAWR
jgi:hypothetical protein